MSGQITIVRADFTDHLGVAHRTGYVLDVPPLDLIRAPDGGAGLERLLADVADAVGMDLVLLGHVNAHAWTAIAVLSRNPALTLPPGFVIPIHETYCRQEITADAPFVMGDATIDPRFKTHPGYTKYGLRSYVGAPLVLSDGTLFGTLCAVDVGPKAVSLAAVERLVSIAETASREISGRLGLAPPTRR